LLKEPGVLERAKSVTEHWGFDLFSFKRDSWLLVHRESLIPSEKKANELGYRISEREYIQKK